MKSPDYIDAQASVEALEAKRGRWAKHQFRATWGVLILLSVTVCVAVFARSAGPQQVIAAIQVPDALATAIAALGDSAHGGHGDFGSVIEQLNGFASGAMLKVMGVCGLLLGLAIGVIKQSVGAAVLGVMMASTTVFLPAMLDNVVGGAAGATHGRSVAAVAQEAFDRHDAQGVRMVLERVGSSFSLEGEFVLAQIAAGKENQGGRSDTARIVAKLAGQKEIVPRPDVLYALEAAAFGTARSESAKAYLVDREGRAQLARMAAWALAGVTALVTSALGAWLLVSFLISRRIRRINELLASV